MNYYDQIASGYEELHREEQLKKINLIKHFLNLKKSDKLLDIGCGTGLSTRFWDCKRFGVDPAKELIKRAKLADPDGDYQLAFAEDLPFKDNFFDIVISVTAIQNFDDIEISLKEIKRVAKKNSIIVISFLKKSKKSDMINALIKKEFVIVKKILEDKDIIYLLDDKKYIKL